MAEKPEADRRKSLAPGEFARRTGAGAPSLGRILELSLFLRVVAAVGVEWYVGHKGSGRICIFPDAEYYWKLAGTIRRGELYQIVDWGDIPHFALRTPGYPAFLAACQTAFGERPLAARLVQAILGTFCVWLVYKLSQEVLTGPSGSRPDEAANPKSWTVPLTASAIAAVHPYFLITSAVLLSEAVFVPLMMLSLWGMAVLWRRSTHHRPSVGLSAMIAIGVGVGMASGAAILARPSWSLFVPLMVIPWLATAPRDRGTIIAAMGLTGLIFLGVVLVMGPWWVRNFKIHGRFIPTAVWMGASLYDGLNPDATGASDMSFLGSPEFWPLDELDQDRKLTREALRFVFDQPGRACELALIKLGRYWCPWPSAEGFRSPALGLISAVTMTPLLGMIVWGLRRHRTDVRCWVLLAGPLLYFCLLHMIFAGSMRYRIPAEFPAMGLAAASLSSRRIPREAW